MKQNVIILVGPSGSGKSTFAALHRGDATVVCSADDYFATSDGGYDFRPEDLGEAHGACLITFIDAVACEIEDVIVDNTNCTAIEVAPYLAIAQAYGATVEVRVFDAPLDTLVSRAQHGAPEHAIKRQQANLHAMLADWPPWWPEPIHNK